MMVFSLFNHGKFNTGCFSAVFLGFQTPRHGGMPETLPWNPGWSGCGYPMMYDLIDLCAEDESHLITKYDNFEVLCHDVPCLDYQWLVFAIGRSIGHISSITIAVGQNWSECCTTWYPGYPKQNPEILCREPSMSIAWSWLLHSFSGNPQASPWPSPAGIKLLNAVRWRSDGKRFDISWCIEWNGFVCKSMMEWILCKAFNANLWLKHILINIYIYDLNVPMYTAYTLIHSGKISTGSMKPIFVLSRNLQGLLKLLHYNFPWMKGSSSWTTVKEGGLSKMIQR